MNVWVVIPDFDCEGYGEPVGAFDSLEKASDFVKKETGSRSYRLEVIELKVE